MAFNPKGTRLPSSPIAPTAKAMSVAIGIPQHHATKGTRDRKRRLTRRSKFIDKQFAFDFQTTTKKSPSTPR